MYFSPLARSRDFSDCFVVIFDSFYFLNSLQSNNNCNIVYILWHKYVWALFKAHFNVSNPKHFYARKRKLYCSRSL